MLSIINQAKKNKKFYVIDDYISSPTSAKSIARMLVEIIDRKLIFSEKIKCNIFNFHKLAMFQNIILQKKLLNI